MRQPWVKRRITFLLILNLIVLGHIFSLFQKIQFDRIEEAKTQKPLVVKLQDISKIHKRQQIVTSEESDSHDKKENAFLSDKDRSFERQTRARVNDTFRSGQRPSGTPREQKKVRLSDLGSVAGEDPFKVAAQEYSDKKNGIKSQAQESHEVSATNDYLKDIPLGDTTHLNTVEYKYYGFYHRIKQKLEQFWGRSLQDKSEQLARAGRRVPASEELITSLQVTLDSSGEVLAVRIIGTSGIKELDDAAVESFKEAGPFPNPPKGLIRDGKVTLEWGFVVKS